jgi:hypothetical protein
VKIIRRFHLTPVRLATSEKADKTNAGKDAGKGNPYSQLVGMQNSAPTMAISAKAPQRIKNRTNM